MSKEAAAEEKRGTSVRSLDKAVFILKTLAGMDNDIDLAALSKMVKMPKSTLLRILSTLRNNHLVQQDDETKRFSLGIGMIALGKAAEKHFNLEDVIHPVLMELTEKTGETASMVVLEDDHAVYIDQVASKSMIRGQTRIGLSLDLHSSSCGKVLLAAMDEEELADFLKGRNLQQRTQKTIVDKDKLLKEIAKVREQGHAVDDEEVEVGGRCIAAPLRDRNGHVIAAISVMGPISRMRQKDFPAIAQTLKEEVMKASVKLGYKKGKGVK
ncbi:MAG: IclR family transcriptional regulator [Spirochaetales bacterium]|nr:IclR family transcriptional regulator [Spirochaetales bacterium]